MNPILYAANETDFNSRGIGTLKETLEYKVTEVLNNEFELFLEYPVSGQLYEKIEDSMVIKVKPNRKDDPHLFRIYEHEMDIETQTVIVYARSNTFDLAGNMVREVNVVDGTPQEAMDLMKANLIEPSDFTFYSDITTRSSTTWKRRNALNCIAGEQGSLIQYWGGEIKRGNKWLWLYRRRGNDNVTTIRYGKDLAGLKAKYSTKGLVTAILPYCTILGESEDEDITLVGDVVKSQYVNNYPVVYYDAVEFTEDDGVKDLESLNQAAANYFTEHHGKDLPNINMNVKLIDLSHTKEFEKFKGLEQVEIGDTITVYAKKFKVNLTAKVIKVVYNGMTNENEELEIGSVKSSTYDDYKELIDRTVKPVKEQINSVQIAANGKNKIYRGVDEPTTNLSAGDLWYKPVGDGEVEMYQFTGVLWELVVSTAINAETEQRLTDAKKQADDARDGTAALQIEADSILKGLGVDVLSETHAQTVADIQANVGDVIASKVDGTSVEYQALIEQSDLYSRVIGTTEPDVEDNVSRIVQSSEIIQTEVASFTGDHPDIWTTDTSANIESGAWQYRYANSSWETNVQYKFIISVLNNTPFSRLTGLEFSDPISSVSPYEFLYSEGVREYYSRIVVFDFETDELELINQSTGTIFGFRVESLKRHTPGSLADRIGDTSTKVTQLADSWALTLTENDDIVAAINASSEGVYIAGKNIILDGDTTVDGTFTVTDELFAPNMSIDKFTTGTLNAAEVNIINMNVDNLVGNTSTFVQSAWNSISSRVTIEGSGMKISTTNSWDLWLDNSGIDLTDKNGNITGKMTALVNSVTGDPISIGLVAEQGFDAIIGYQGSVVDNSYDRAISVDGTTGETTLYKKIQLRVNDIFPNSGSTDNFYFNSLIGGGIRWANNKGSSSIDLLNNSTIELNADKVIADTIFPYSNSHTGMELRTGTVSGHEGVWLRDHTESSGIFMARNGYLYIMVRGGIYSMKTIAESAGFTVN